MGIEFADRQSQLLGNPKILADRWFRLTEGEKIRRPRGYRPAVGLLSRRPPVLAVLVLYSLGVDTV